MKKMLFLILIGSIITAQPQANKSDHSPKKIRSSQDIQNMVNDRSMNRPASSFKDETGRPTREEWQKWDGNTWVNDYAIDYSYAIAKSQAGQFPDLTTIPLPEFITPISNCLVTNAYPSGSQ